jgi:acyl carrier protein
MNNLEKYENTFTEIFDISKEQLNGLKYQDIENWDSVGHMSLVAAMEDVFEVEMDTDDIIDFSSFQQGTIILKKYGVEF